MYVIKKQQTNRGGFIKGDNLDWKDKYTEEEVEIAFFKWKKLYRPSSTEEPDHAYIFHIALTEGDISNKHLWKVTNRLRDKYRREILGGVRKTVVLDDGRKVRRWEYPDLLLNEEVHTDYYNQHNKKTSRTRKSF